VGSTKTVSMHYVKAFRGVSHFGGRKSTVVKHWPGSTSGEAREGGLLCQRGSGRTATGKNEVEHNRCYPKDPDYGGGDGLGAHCHYALEREHRRQFWGGDSGLQKKRGGG